MDFTALTEKIKEARLSALRVADMTAGSYRIEADADDSHLILVDVSNPSKRHRLTINALASLRTAKSKESVKDVKTTMDARGSAAILPLQALVLGDDAITLSDDTRLDVIHTIQIYDAVRDELVYREDNYKGYSTYVAESRKAGAMPTDTPEQVAARNLRYAEINAELRESGIKKNDESLLRTLPVVLVK